MPAHVKGRAETGILPTQCRRRRVAFCSRVHLRNEAHMWNRDETGRSEMSRSAATKPSSRRRGGRQTACGAQFGSLALGSNIESAGVVSKATDAVRLERAHFGLEHRLYSAGDQPALEVAQGSAYRLEP